MNICNITMSDSSFTTTMEKVQHFPQKLAIFILTLNFFQLMEFTHTQTVTKEVFPYYYVGCYNARTDLLQESIYAKLPVTCVEICELQAFSYAVLAFETCFCANKTLEEERQDAHLCNNRCLADKTQYCGGAGVHSYYSTRLAKEPAPKHLKLTKVTDNSLSIMWEVPHPINKVYIPTADVEVMALPPQITHFLIKSQLVLTFSTLPIYPLPEYIVQASQSTFELNNLQAATTYSISVVAMCERIVCGHNATILGTTLVGQPDPVPPEPRILRQTDHTMTVQIPVIKNNNGPVSKLYVLVERVDEALSQNFDTNALGDWRKAQQDGVPYYITAELEYENRTRKFVVGDGKRYGRYENIPLELADDHVHITLGVESTLNNYTKVLFTRGTHEQHTMSLDNFTYVNFESGRESIIALIVVCIIFAIFLVLSCITYFYLRKKNYGGYSRNNANETELTPRRPFIEHDNDSFIVDDEPPTVENFEQQLNALVNSLDGDKRLPRRTIRIHQNDVIAEGRYGEVITGKLLTGDLDCQVHMIDFGELNSTDKAQFLQEFRQITRLQQHPHLLNFYGVSASSDWFYMVFEQQPVSLKKCLLESRLASTEPRISALQEEFVLQLMDQLASALLYLNNCRIVQKQLSSHNIYVTAQSQLKLSSFGPVPYGEHKKQIDLSRWMAPECLTNQSYSSKSDVWAFACVAWECCALGGTPYANITTSGLLEHLQRDKRPIQPPYVFSDLYQMLRDCWQYQRSERPDFEEIQQRIQALMISPKHALSFDRTYLLVIPPYLPQLEIREES